MISWIPLVDAIAKYSINYFLDQIKHCEVCDFDSSFDSMDKTKSIGFGASNRKIFSRHDPEMKEYLMDFVLQSQQCILNVIVNASQKDEVRVADKTARLFTAFPPEHTFLATIIFGNFMDQFVKNRFCTNGSISSVGDSMQSGAGRIYYNELSQYPYSYCTDTSAQDASVNPDFIQLFYDLLKMKYELNDREEMMYNNVVHNSINKLINMNGDLYLVSRGLGSGDYLTIVINIMWRFYMFCHNYHHKFYDILRDNKLVICGDDFMCGSKHPDLDLNSPYAQITWAGKPVSWDEMDFCSVKFKPYVHHDENKVLAVLRLRKKKQHQLDPDMEMQRLGGLLRVLSTERVYNQILKQMRELTVKHPSTQKSYQDLFVSFEEVYNCYNDPFTTY
jgi:hypothetical protein